MRMRFAAIAAAIGICLAFLLVAGAPTFSQVPSGCGPGIPCGAGVNYFNGIRSARTWTAFGDSITYNADAGNLTNGPCGAATSNCYAQLSGSYATWINIYTGYRAYKQPGYNCGLNGAGATQLLAQVSCVLNMNPDFVVMQVGGNDAAGSVSCNSYTTTVRQIYAIFMNAGIAVFKVGTYPRSGANTFNTTASNLAQCYNQRDRTFANSSGNRGFYFVDLESVAVDPINTTIQAAAVATGGATCTNGVQTFTVSGGSSSAAATLTGTVSGNALSGALTMVNGGYYTVVPGNPVTLTGGGCGTPPTANLTTATWVSPSGCLYDGSHPGQNCGSQMGALIANQINTIIPPWHEPNYSQGDVYDATNNPGGNLLTNGMLQGTGGTASTCTGTVPNSTTLVTGGLGGGACAGTVGTTSDGRPTMTVTMSGTSTGTNLKAFFYQEALSLANFSAGDTIYAEGCVSLGPNTGLSDAAVVLLTTENAVTYFATTGSGGGGAAPSSGYAMSGGGCGPGFVMQITPPRTLTAIPTKVELDLSVDLLGTTSGTVISGTVTYASMAIRKVQQ